jgi:hypothetical protein
MPALRARGGHRQLGIGHGSGGCRVALGLTHDGKVLHPTNGCHVCEARARSVSAAVEAIR